MSQSVDKVVESSSQIVNGVPADNRDIRRNLGVLFYIVSAISSIRIFLKSDGIGFFAEKGIDGPLQIVNVLLGPFAF